MALKLLFGGIFNFVRGVAIGANRPALVAFGQQLAVNALIVRLLDAQVAFAAGLGDVGVVDRRIAVHVAFDVMHAVAIVARRRHNQSHFQQGVSVDAVHVFGRRLGDTSFRIPSSDPDCYGTWRRFAGDST